MPSLNPYLSFRTEAREARSSRSTRVRPVIFAAAAAAASTLRQARTTVAPWAARWRAV